MDCAFHVTLYLNQGTKIVILGNFDSKYCFESRYQPFKYWTNVSSDCIFLRSKCKEEGQVMYSTGPDHDTTCRCDHTKGYDFITKPHNLCFCIPSQEDCSCYKRNCPIARPKLIWNYTCVQEIEKETPSDCNNLNTPVDGATKDRDQIFPEVRENNIEIGGKWRQNASVSVLVTTIVLMCVLHGIFEYERQLFKKKGMLLTTILCRWMCTSITIKGEC